jgi:hypothetical protein
LTEKISFNTQVSYDQGEHFAAVANVKIKTIAGLTVTPEVIYQDNFAKKDADAWGGMFRFQRTF